MLNVVLDSNIFRQDLTLEGARFQVLFAQARSGGFRIVLPEVVAIETQRLFEGAVEKARDEHERGARRLRSLGVEVPAFEPTDAQEAAEAFRKRLEEIVASAGGAVAPIPEVPHRLLVESAVRRRKPFRDKGTGYRDALIWHGVLRLAQDNVPVAFVTENHADFGASDGSGLHPDLIADLTATGADRDSVVLYKDLAAFLDAQAARDEEALARVRELLHRDEFRKALEDKLATALVEHPRYDEGDSLLRNLGIDVEGGMIEALDHIDSIEANRAYVVGDGEASVDLQVGVVALMDIFLWKGDAYALDRGDEIDVPVHVYDFDWNESFAAAEAYVPLTVSAQIALDADGDEIEALEIVEIGPG